MRTWQRKLILKYHGENLIIYNKFIQRFLNFELASCAEEFKRVYRKELHWKKTRWLWTSSRPVIGGTIGHQNKKRW